MSKAPVGQNVPQEEKLRIEKEVEKWNKDDNKAPETVVTRMEEGAIMHILSCSTSCEIWSKLLTIYEQKSDVSIHIGQHRFF